jgi:3',5'-nucleoside bisphosphate phosphatase
MKRWLLTDLHIHTTWSDGTVPMEEVVTLYGEAGFDVIALTDHLFDTRSPLSRELREGGKSVLDVGAYFGKVDEASRWAKEKYGLLILRGLEICNLDEDYHLLGIDLKEGINPDLPAEAVIREIHRQGGLAIASHPHLKLSYFLSGDQVSIQRHPLHLWKQRGKYASMLDAWEIANRADLFPEVGLERLPFVASSDFHERAHLDSWKSLVRAEKEREAFKEAVRRREVSLFFFRTGEAEAISPREPAPSPSPPDRSPKGDSTAARVLVADDERDLVGMLAYNLDKKGYAVQTAFNGFEAWEKVTSWKPDVLLLDLMMPDLDGWEVCRLIRRSDEPGVRETPVLMLTSRALPEDRIHGFEAGADDYLTKPFSLNELLLRLERLVEKRRALRSLRDEMVSLRKSVQEKEHSLRIVAHDLKTPLISMGACAKRMLRRTAGDEPAPLLKNIYDDSLRLTRWIDDSLRPVGTGGGQTETDLTGLLERAVRMCEELAREKKIGLRLQTPPALLLTCHEPLLSRAVGNLLSNALKFTPPGGSVEVTVVTHFEHTRAEVVEIVVTDTGIGIPEEDMAGLFTPYYRARNVLAEDGQGLGLCQVKEAVDHHGGKILIQSEVRKGTTVSVLLPRRHESETEEATRGESREFNQAVTKM